MSFVKSLEEIKANYSETAEFYDAEALTVYFQTNPETIKQLLPPPLQPTPLPLGGVFVANYPKTSFCPAYLESALFLFAQHNGEKGIFILSMPVTDDIALILGREVFGYPKKIAEIHLDREDNNVRGWTERHGVRFLDAKANLSGRFNDENAQK